MGASHRSSTPAPLLTDEEDEHAITIGSRQAVMGAGTSGWEEACQVELPYRHLDDQGLVETVELFVAVGGRRPGDALRRGTGVRGVIDQRLPA